MLFQRFHLPMPHLHCIFDRRFENAAGHCPSARSVEYMGVALDQIFWQVTKRLQKTARFVHFLDYSYQYTAMTTTHIPLSWQAGNTIEDGPFTVMFQHLAGLADIRLWSG